MPKPHPNSKPKQKTYVVGHKCRQFCVLVPATEGEFADDQALENAARFNSLREAIKASDEHSCSVFEIVEEKGQVSLREFLVDLNLIAKVPYPDCYFVRDSLLAGPSYVALSDEVTTTRIAALAHAGVGVIVSVCSRGELFFMDEVTHRLDLYELFDHHVFPIVDGGAPSKAIMRTILNTIDGSLDKGNIVFTHCVGGVGRTGLVVGCWLVRHRIAVGDDAIDELAAIRYKHGLFRPSPETEAQRKFIRAWPVGG